MIHYKEKTQYIVLAWQQLAINMYTIQVINMVSKFYIMHITYSYMHAQTLSGAVITCTEVHDVVIITTHTVNEILDR